MIEPLDYTRYITSAHKSRPRFVATVDITANAFADIQKQLLTLIDGHFIDNAVGKQLDTCGEWIGQSRYIKSPLKGIYFAWDDNRDNGWQSGIWWDTYSPMEAMVKLDDSSYRYLLKMFISANRWNGSTPLAYDIWEQAFGSDNFVLVTDYQNMSIDLGFSGALPAPVKAMLKAGIIPFKPESVRVRTFFTNNYGGPMFGWDISNEAINGYDVAAWADTIEMS